jgi:hypothetical protein
MRFFTDDNYYTGSPLSDDMVRAAEATVGFRLPGAYLKLLRERNGGVPIRRCVPTLARTSWADDHIEISGLLGIGSERSIDGKLGSAYLIQEWGYPDIGIVICDTPSGGHDTVMLDYRKCGPEGEPQVVYIDDDRTILPLAANFAEFADRLIDCDKLKLSMPQLG